MSLRSVIFYGAILYLGVVSWHRADFAVGWEFTAGLCVAFTFAAVVMDFLLSRFAREHRENMASLNEVKRQYEEWVEAAEEEEGAR